MTRARCIRGRLLTFAAQEAPPLYIENGALLVEAGKITAVGEWDDVRTRAPVAAQFDDHRDKLIMPGFIDAHIHYPQTRVIASYGAQLLEWLQKYTFVEEQKFHDVVHAEKVANFFLDELARCGTTTAAVYCTSHPNSVEAFFAASQSRGLRMIAGKVMMDRNAPNGLMDTAERGYAESRDLIARMHGRGRFSYAITPRFAVTSTEAQLEAAGALAKEFPEVHIQTHLNENIAEIDFVKMQFPWAANYLDVYDRFGLLGARSIFGHCIHMSDAEIRRMAETRSVAAFCPTSNLFLGSGLFDQAKLRGAGVRVALATDVGGGTSYSMLQTAAEAYKVLQMGGQSWPPLAAFRQMTRGNAEVLGLDDSIGALEVGYEADLVVLDAGATPAMAHRMQSVAGTLAEELFVLTTLGDDRAVVETYVAGERAKTTI